MLGQPPLILNDFEAEAWALAGDSGTFAALGSSPAVTVQQPGTYCVLGMTSGLGVSVLTRNRTGDVHVLATEAGHAGFAPASRSMADLVDRMFPDRYPVVAEHLISAPGLVAIHSALAATRGVRNVMTKPEDITRAANSDPLAREACALLCEAFWSHVDSLILTYGAWDGVIVTGGLAHALRGTLSAPRKQYLSPDSGRYTRQLAAVPRTLVELDHGELLGAAQALQRLSH